MAWKTQTSKRVQSYANREIKSSKNVWEGMYKEYINKNDMIPYYVYTIFFSEWVEVEWRISHS